MSIPSLDEPKVTHSYASDPDFAWKYELAKLFRCLSILTITFVNKIKEDDKKK